MRKSLLLGLIAAVGWVGAAFCLGSYRVPYHEQMSDAELIVLADVLAASSTQELQWTGEDPSPLRGGLAWIRIVDTVRGKHAPGEAIVIMRDLRDPGPRLHADERVLFILKRFDGRMWGKTVPASPGQTANDLCQFQYPGDDRVLYGVLPVGVCASDLPIFVLACNDKGAYGVDEWNDYVQKSIAFHQALKHETKASVLAALENLRANTTDQYFLRSINWMIEAVESGKWAPNSDDDEDLRSSLRSSDR